MANVSEGLQALEQAFDLAEHQGDADSRRLAAAANCAATARVGNAHAVMQWAGRFDSLHAKPDVVGESEIIVSLSLALLQQGRVAEGLRELTWLDSDVPAPARASSNAVGALLDVANADFVSARQRIDAVLSSECTYLDRFRARIALVGLHYRQGRIGEARTLMEQAVAEVGATGDRITRPLGSLFAGVCGYETLEGAEQRARALGIDTVGWITALRTVIGSELVGGLTLTQS
jgi:hypothetical protein